MAGRLHAILFALLAMGATGVQAAADGDDPVPLAAPAETAARIDLAALLFPREPPRLLRAQLRISGIDPEDVRRTLEALNARSEIGQFTPEGFSPAPHVLERMLDLRPDQVLQFRWSGQAGKLVFRFTWR